jgi:hypothetical protein
MLDEFDAEAALARLVLPETPVLLDTTLEQLLYEADVCPHHPADTQSIMHQEQTQTDVDRHQIHPRAVPRLCLTKQVSPEATDELVRLRRRIHPTWS